MTLRLAVFIGLGLAAAAPASAEFACPSKGLTHAPATFVTATGRHKFDLEVAASAEAQQCGLMYRKTMKPGAGMIFPFTPPRDATFWMENTVLPLDLVFVGPDSKVLSIATGKPFSRDMIPSGGITASVIEPNAGQASKIGLKPGDRVEK
ncbi:MAG: DUF192 domain-containing protein [Sandarakinorhabdus sp.]|nr:DUF192 domain-containing protein [Sandarakinorhabdus sp.]